MTEVLKASHDRWRARWKELALERHKKLSAVEALHKPERRYTYGDGGEMSWASVDDVIDYFGDDEVTADKVDYFEVCAECGRIELSQVEEYDERGYLEAMWPCKTAKALGLAGGA